MNPDEQLLNKNNQSSEEKAGDLNQARRESADNNSSDNSNPSDLNSLRHQAQVNKEKKDKEKEKKGSSASLSSPIRKGTNELLKGSWLNLIDSWGLTLIWIDIHIFLRQVLGGKLFGKLGTEWAPKGLSVPGEKDSKKGTMLEIVEPIGAGCCNLGCLLIVIALLAIVAMIVNAVENPISTLASLVGSAIRNFFTGN